MKWSDFSKIAKKCDSFYIFIGEERVLMDEMISKMGIPRKTVDSIDSLIEKYRAKDLFGNRNVLVYKGSDIDENVVNSLLDGEGGLHKAIIILDKLDKRGKAYKALGKTTDRVVEFDKLTPSQLVDRIRKMDERYTLQLATILAFNCNLDLGRVNSEVNKLKAHGGELTDKLIYDMVTPYAEDVIFDMVGAVGDKDIESVYAYMEDLKIIKESPVVVLFNLYRTFRNLLIVQGYSKLSPDEVASKTGMNPRAVWAIKKQIGKFSIERLVGILKILEDADRGIKMGKYDPDLILQKVLLDILGN